MTGTTAPEDEPVVWWLSGDDADTLLSLLEEQATTLAPPDTDAGDDRSGSAGSAHSTGPGAGRMGAGSGAAAGPGPGGGAAYVTRGSGPARLGIVDPNERKVRLARRMLTEGQPWRGRSDLWFTPSGLADGGGKVAFLFPGVEPTFGAEDIDLPGLGRRLDVDAPAMSEDTIAHRSASIVRLGIFVDQVLHRLGITPDLVAGHSIGEWSASVATGMFSRQAADQLLDGIDLGGIELPDLDFAALSSGADAVEPVVADIEGIVVSHDNCPGQSVICGPPYIVERALVALREAGILGYTLDFQSGFHTPFIEPSLVEFRHYLEGMAITAPAIPLWSATTTSPYPTDRAEIIELHLRHLVEPVRFRPMIERLYHEAGVRIFVQAGIGTLTGFVDDTLGTLDHATVQVVTPKRSALAQAHRALTALWVEGLDVSPDALRSPATPGFAADSHSAPAGTGATSASRPSAADSPSSPADPGATSDSGRSAIGSPSSPAAAPPATPSTATPTPAPQPALAPVAASSDPASTAPAVTPPASAPPASSPALAPAAAAHAVGAGTVAVAQAGPGVTAVAESARAAAASAVAGDAGGSAYPLLAAAELLTAAARASQDVLDALSARISPHAFQAAPPAAGLATAQPAQAQPPAAGLAAPAQAQPSGITTGSPVPGSAQTGSRAGFEAGQGSGSAEVPATTGSGDAVPPARRQPGEQAPQRPWPTGKTVLTRRLSLETMPETIDHSLFHQPPGWHDPTDGFPIVAMTTQIQLLQDVAAEFAGGREIIEVFGVRNLRWLDLSSPQDVDITIIPKAEDVLSVALGGFCRANIRVGDYRPAPRHDLPPITNPHTTKLDAQELFDSWVMFHGPMFQGINTLGPTGDDGILGEFHNLDTPGSLLDNLGKIIAYWVIEQRNLGESPLPIGVDRIEFFGPLPPPGIDLHCDVRILELQPELVRADGVIVLPDGNVWCKVEGWMSNVFHIDQVMQPIYHRTEHSYAAEPQPGGWNVVIERWPTGAGRDLTARRFLTRSERAQYEGKNLLEQRRWLIDVIAAKDSVRRWLGERDIPAYPVEIALEPEGEHRFRARSPLIPEGHDLHVTVSSLHWLAVGVVGDGAYLDIEAREVVEGADPALVAQEAVAAVQSRNPGAAVEVVDRVDAITPSNIDVVVIPRFAVAWTEPAPRH